MGEGGWSVHPSRDVQACITAMHGIILATERPKEGSRKQFVTIYFVGESISVGTTNSFTLATYIPDMRACITFGNGTGRASMQQHL